MTVSAGDADDDDDDCYEFTTQLHAKDAWRQQCRHGASNQCLI